MRTRHPWPDLLRERGQVPPASPSGKASHVGPHDVPGLVTERLVPLIVKAISFWECGGLGK
jgi:hypothetical protein